jgi:hypothetical protein
VLTHAATTYAIADADPAEWYYPAAAELLVHVGADEGEPRRLRWERDNHTAAVSVQLIAVQPAGRERGGAGPAD